MMLIVLKKYLLCYILCYYGLCCVATMNVIFAFNLQYNYISKKILVKKKSSKYYIQPLKIHVK